MSKSYIKIEDNYVFMDSISLVRVTTNPNNEPWIYNIHIYTNTDSHPVEINYKKEEFRDEHLQKIITAVNEYKLKILNQKGAENAKI